MEPAARVKHDRADRADESISETDRTSVPLVRQRAQANGLAAGENHLQTEDHVGDPAVARHAVADAAFVDHGADDIPPDRRCRSWAASAHVAATRDESHKRSRRLRR